MVKQKKFSDQDADTKRRISAIIGRLTNRVDCTQVDPNNPDRRGIIKLREPDDPTVDRKFYPHQVVAVHNLILKNIYEPYYVRKSAQAWLHNMGTGKTISTVLAVAALSKLVPHPRDFRIMLVVPLGVITTWHETFKTWTTLGDTVVKATKQDQITAEILDQPHVLLTTKDVLVSAFKTFMWYNPKSEEYQTRDGKTKYRAGWDAGWNPKPERMARKKLAKYPDGRPPKHPLFAYIDTMNTTPVPDVGFTDAKPHSNYPDARMPAWAGGFIDEIHACCNPKTQNGQVLYRVFRNMVYTVGLTGTPVRSKPAQVANMCKILNVSGENAWMQDAMYWNVTGRGNASLRPDTINKFHEEIVDRVDEDTLDLPAINIVRLQFDPWVGRNEDGTFNKEQHTTHNWYLERAQKAAAEAAALPANVKRDQDKDKYLWQCFSTTTQMCMNGVLGQHGVTDPRGEGVGFNANPRLYKEALKQPSEQMKLIWHMIRDRQQKGHGRIVIYCESSVMLTLLRNQLSKWGECGKLYLYTGSLPLKQRDAMIRDFLSPESPRGIIFISSAGAVGTTLCPGCDTMFAVGDIPWNNSDLKQAFGRVHRISQDKPVEIVQFEPRRSVISAKLKSHIDKRDRLEPAMRDADFSNFDQTVDQGLWKTLCLATLNLTTVDDKGNYKETPDQQQQREAWQQACESARQAGNEPPPMPEEIVIPTPVLAKDYPLPPCSFPVEGFVEPPLAPDDDEDDSDPEENSDEEEEEVQPKAIPKRKVGELLDDNERDALHRSVRRALAMREHVVEPDDSSDDEEDREEPTEEDTEFINDESESEAEETDNEDDL
tara:strand:+ start:261 stop:2738 length:2478 start_codon:yes stop_codon:yes gene_type:complete